MASLNTLRTKFGVVLSVILGLALLAFVLSLKTEMGFSGNDPKVGEIDGDKIKYSEYLEQYDRVKARSGASESNPQQADMLADATWQALVSKHVLEPGFEKLGLTVGESERLTMLAGERYSQVYYQAFADPRTGVYHPEAVAEFLTQAETDPQARAAWNFLNQQALLDRAMAKYITLLKSGMYVNDLETTQGMQAANNTYTGRWARRKYASLPDSLFTVPASEIRSYYNRHKDEFRQLPSRTLSYVVFDVNATNDDMLALTKTVAGVGAEFTAVEEIRPFVRANRNGRIADNYVSAAQLDDDEAEALLNGRAYGPLLKNNVWRMARVIDTKVAADTLGIRHIILSYQDEKLADSLKAALKDGVQFAQAARQYSLYDATAAQGGDVGMLPFSAFTGEFADALAGAKEGDIVKIPSGDVIQLMQVYYAGKPTKQVRLASIEYPVEASSGTRRAAHNAAGSFSVNAKGSVEAFNEAASAAAVTPRVATLTQGERQLRGLEDSRELVRWAYGAEKGDVSEIFTVDGDYVVAMVTDIDDDRYTSLDKASELIRRKLLRDKKYDYIVSDVKGTTFPELTMSLGTSESGQFENVSYASFYINGVGMEPRLVGAIASAPEKGYVSAPVKGAGAVYVFQVDEITTEEKQTAEAEQVREQAMLESMVPQQTMQAIQQMADVQDLRGRYF